jgi:hypothetical protein
VAYFIPQRRSPPGLSHLLDLELDTEPARLSQTPVGARLAVVLTGGLAHGPALEGRVLPGGGDWRIEGTGDSARLDVELTIATADGDLVLCEASGVIDVPDDAHDRLRAGAALAADELYLRVTTRFETGAGELAWLGRIVAVGVGSLTPTGAHFEVFQVL